MVDVVDAGVIHVDIPLRDQEDALILHHGALKRGDGLLSAHVKVEHHMRKDHQPAQRQHRQGDRLRAFLFRLGQIQFLLACRPVFVRLGPMFSYYT